MVGAAVPPFWVSVPSLAPPSPPSCVLLVVSSFVASTLSLCCATVWLSLTKGLTKLLDTSFPHPLQPRQSFLEVFHLHLAWSQTHLVAGQQNCFYSAESTERNFKDCTSMFRCRLYKRNDRTLLHH